MKDLKTQFRSRVEPVDIIQYLLKYRTLFTWNAPLGSSFKFKFKGNLSQYYYYNNEIKYEIKYDIK